MNGCIFWNNIQKFVGFYFKGSALYDDVTTTEIVLHWTILVLDNHCSLCLPLRNVPGLVRRNCYVALSLRLQALSLRLQGCCLFLRCPLVIRTHWASHVLLPSVGRYKDRYCGKISDEVGNPFKRMIMFNS